jgi:hypothetical protein
MNELAPYFFIYLAVSWATLVTLVLCSFRRPVIAGGAVALVLVSMTAGLAAVLAKVALGYL